VHFSRCMVAASAGLFAYLSSSCQRAAEDVLTDYRPASGDWHRFRCSTVGELLRDSDWVFVIAVREKCDEKGPPLLEKREKAHPQFVSPNDQRQFASSSPL
jgi:hypothetical protein